MVCFCLIVYLTTDCDYFSKIPWNETNNVVQVMWFWPSWSHKSCHSGLHDLTSHVILAFMISQVMSFWPSWSHKSCHSGLHDLTSHVILAFMISQYYESMSLLYTCIVSIAIHSKHYIFVVMKYNKVTVMLTLVTSSR